MNAYRLITGLSLVLLLLASAFWGWHQWQIRTAYTPRAAFLVGQGTGSQTVTAFIDYRCGNCGAFYKALGDLKDLRPDVTLIVRPLAFIDQQSVRLSRIALAAGTQGRFPEIHAAFLERDGAFDDAFLRETLSLYGLDLSEIEKKAGSSEVEALFQDNVDDAVKLGVGTIPSLMIGDMYHPAQNPIENFSVSDILPLLAPAR